MQKLFLILLSVFLTNKIIAQNPKQLSNGLSINKSVLFKVKSNKEKYNNDKFAKVMLVSDSDKEGIIRVVIFLTTDIAYFHEMSEAYFYIDQEYSYKVNLTKQLASKDKNTTALRYDGNFNFLLEEPLVKIDIATGYETLTLQNEDIHVFSELELKQKNED
ncbi:hypothetical protein ACSTS3_01315 [Aquimarina muelleri]|uniref:hypothetical protein n=1 Tax=Aquimarina muelleri TaxID=279356 RepID=UPI003F686F1D